jgi:hypothetical protein
MQKGEAWIEHLYEPVTRLSSARSRQQLFDRGIPAPAGSAFLQPVS